MPDEGGLCADGLTLVVTLVALINDRVAIDGRDTAQNQKKIDDEATEQPPELTTSSSEEIQTRYLRPTPVAMRARSVSHGAAPLNSAIREKDLEEVEIMNESA
jgi:hypothetical protein